MQPDRRVRRSRVCSGREITSGLPRHRHENAAHDGIALRRTGVFAWRRARFYESLYSHLLTRRRGMWITSRDAGVNVTKAYLNESAPVC